MTFARQATCLSLTLKASALAAVVALSGAAVAQPPYETFQAEFRYHADESPRANYSAFLCTAHRHCHTPGIRPLAMMQRERACVADLMDKLVAKLGSAEIAQLHLERTTPHNTRPIDASRTLASR